MAPVQELLQELPVRNYLHRNYLYRNYLYYLSVKRGRGSAPVAGVA